MTINPLYPLYRFYEISYKKAISRYLIARNFMKKISSVSRVQL